MKPGIATLSTAAMIAAVFLAASAPPAEAARICKPSYLSKTSTPLLTRALARASAAAKWSAGVSSRHGLSWSNWGNATAKDYSCWRKTTVIGTNSWRCRARAKPCKFN